MPYCIDCIFHTIPPISRSNKEDWNKRRHLILCKRDYFQDQSIPTLTLKDIHFDWAFECEYYKEEVK